MSLRPSSACARELCRSAPRDGCLDTTRWTTSAHLRCSSPGSDTAGVSTAPAQATWTAADADGAEAALEGADGAEGAETPEPGTGEPPAEALSTGVFEAEGTGASDTKPDLPAAAAPSAGLRTDPTAAVGEGTGAAAECAAADDGAGAVAGRGAANDETEAAATDAAGAVSARAAAGAGTGPSAAAGLVCESRIDAKL